ncbi:MAG: 5-(carboxyamino)imidazole ribonucleotide synthase [Rickettsiales bacterium]
MMSNNTENSPLPPSSVIGILGGGQLGRMLAIAAAEMGYKTHIYCPEENSPASEVASFTTIGSYEDAELLSEFASKVDVITYEFENIPFAPIEKISHGINVFPSPQILAISQHRLLEKQTINEMGIKTAPFTAVTSANELQKSIDKIGLPAVLKTCRMGYDGKGQIMLKNFDDIKSGMDFCATNSKDGVCDLILEGFVNFKMEISVIVASDGNDDIKSYCPVQNIHKNHILSETIAPAPISPELIEKAESIAHKIAKELKLTGLLAIEMFVSKNDDIIINELAPRPHNSGHWTIDACVTSQFEQTIRAICGLPLSNPSRLCDATMLNLIGDDINNWHEYTKQVNAKLHLYGKKDVKSGRKMGHVTFLKI